MRESHIRRKTGETDITLTLNLDGTGKNDIHTGVGFFDHMLTGFARHGSFDLTVTCSGDTWVDDHHTVEDVGIASATLCPGPGRDAGRAALRPEPPPHGRIAGHWWLSTSPGGPARL